MKKLSIIGLGLMGGSLGLAARRAGLAREVCGYARREANRAEAMHAGAVDTVSDSVRDTIRGADFVVCCLPVYTICEVLRSCADAFSSGCVVTDVGSTKADIMSQLTPIFQNTEAHFVGSHPIAGSDATGMAAARKDLYQDAMVIITPSAEHDAATDKTARFWNALGARTAVMSAVEHDRVMASTSHLPHLVAAMLVETVNRDTDVKPYCGSGFRDTTRVAGGSEEIWHDIIKSNQAAVCHELKSFASVLDRVHAMVREGDFDALRAFLAKTMTSRRAFNREDATDG